MNCNRLTQCSDGLLQLRLLDLDGRFEQHRRQVFGIHSKGLIHYFQGSVRIASDMLGMGSQRASGGIEWAFFQQLLQFFVLAAVKEAFGKLLAYGGSVR